jgi:hypothetical protein
VLLTGRSMEIIAEGNWAPGRGDIVRELLATAARRKQALLPELVMAVLAVVGSQVIGSGLAESLGIRRGRVHTDWSAFSVWYRLVALPAYQFLIYRALWRWLIWTRLLWRLSRVPLQPIAAHPDRQGGLGFLSEPCRGFALVLTAMNAVQAAAWWERLDYSHAKVSSLAPQAIVLLLISLVLALGPLLTFAGALWRGRFEELHEYDRLARDYTRMFHARWIERDRREDLLGTPDIQSLSDLGNACEVVRSMRPVPFNLRTVIAVVAASLAPLAPLLLREMSLMAVLKKLGGIAVGGLG